MAKIIITKDNKDFTYDSMNGACKSIDANTSGKNRQSAIRFILSNGYEIKEGASEQEIKDAKEKKPRKSNTWIERIAKKLANVDTELVERLIDEQQLKINNIKNEKDMKEVQTLAEKIENARNPKVTKESFIEYCSQAWDEFQESNKK